MNFKAQILTASAGSGKTYSLAREYIFNTLRLQPEEELRGFNPYIYRTILAVTFTNKATEEMKSRILTQINNLATGEKCEFADELVEKCQMPLEKLRERAMKVRSAILHDYSRFSILTNDTFFQRIVRAFVKELGIDINYSIELDTAPVIQKSVEALIENMESRGELSDWLMEFAEENISQGRQWNIKKGILRLQGELFKEQTKQAIEAIQRDRIKELVTNYLQLSEQLIDKIKDIARSAIELIHSRGYSHNSFVYSFTTYFDSIVNFSDATKPAGSRVLDHCYDSAEQWFKKSPKPTADMLALATELQPMLIDVVSSYERLRYLYNSCTLLRKNYRSFALLGDLYETAKGICQEQNTMLLSETKHTIASFVTEQDAPFIYEKVGNRFEKFMIDEFQDTSLKEWENFRPLLLNAISQSADIAVLLVGDIKQSIYRWRGSNWNILSTIAPKELEQRDTPILKYPLKGNFRSLSTIVEFNNSTMRRVADSQNSLLNKLLDGALATNAISKSLHSELYDAIESAYNSDNLEQTQKRDDIREGYVNITAHYTAQPDIVGRVRELVHQKGYAPGDITILVRTRNEAESVAKVLLNAGIEDESMRFGVMTQEALKLNSAPVVQFILAVMRYAIDRKDVISLAIYNRIYHNFDLYHQLTADEILFFDSIKSCSAEVAFEKIMMHYPTVFTGQSAYTEALHEQIIKFCATKVADIQLFIRWWEDNGSDKSVTIDKDRNAIEVMTIHKSKGLENKVVIIPYCNWRFIPEAIRPSTIWTTPTADSGLPENMLFPVQSTSITANSIFAEGYYKEFVYSHIDAINLLYVALTRPQEQLHIFMPVTKPDKGGSFDSECENVGQLLFKLFNMESLYTPTVEGEPLPEPIVYSDGSYDAQTEDSWSDEGTMFIENYPTSDYRLRLKLSSRRFSEARKGGVVISPQEEGIILHGIMERATTKEDISTDIEQLVIDGILSTQNAAELTAQIERVLNNPLVADWFSGDWQRVMTESSIITPKMGTKRPDRVMINGDRAIVVDYKFGEIDDSHNRQISHYCSLIRQMGYKEVKGYLWYVRKERIEEVI